MVAYFFMVEELEMYTPANRIYSMLSTNSSMTIIKEQTKIHRQLKEPIWNL